jgi:hypothetical protein
MMFMQTTSRVRGWLALPAVAAAGALTSSTASAAGSYYLKGSMINPIGDAQTVFSSDSGGGSGAWIFEELHPAGTAIEASCQYGAGCWGSESDGVGRGAYGHASQMAPGLESYGVYGRSEGSGSQSAGVFGRGAGSGETTGVSGLADSAQGTGVSGEGAGYGVQGTTPNPNGVGILADNTGGGTALKVAGKSTFTGAATLQNGVTISGKSTFSRSGLIDAGGSSQLVKTGVGLTSSSYVLATLQTNSPGAYVRAAVPNPATSTITIYLNTSAPAGAKVAWFVVN